MEKRRDPTEIFKAGLSGVLQRAYFPGAKNDGVAVPPGSSPLDGPLKNLRPEPGWSAERLAHELERHERVTRMMTTPYVGPSSSSSHSNSLIGRDQSLDHVAMDESNDEVIAALASPASPVEIPRTTEEFMRQLAQKSPSARHEYVGEVLTAKPELIRDTWFWRVVLLWLCCKNGVTLPRVADVRVPTNHRKITYSAESMLNMRWANFDRTFRLACSVMLPAARQIHGGAPELQHEADQFVADVTDFFVQEMTTYLLYLEREYAQAEEDDKKFSFPEKKTKQFYEELRDTDILTESEKVPILFVLISARSRFFRAPGSVQFGGFLFSASYPDPPSGGYLSTVSLSSASSSADGAGTITTTTTTGGGSSSGGGFAFKLRKKEAVKPNGPETFALRLEFCVKLWRLCAQWPEHFPKYVLERWVRPTNKGTRGMAPVDLTMLEASIESLRPWRGLMMIFLRASSVRFVDSRCCRSYSYALVSILLSKFIKPAEIMSIATAWANQWGSDLAWLDPVSVIDDIRKGDGFASAAKESPEENQANDRADEALLNLLTLKINEQYGEAVESFVKLAQDLCQLVEVVGRSVDELPMDILTPPRGQVEGRGAYSLTMEWMEKLHDYARTQFIPAYEPVFDLQDRGCQIDLLREKLHSLAHPHYEDGGGSSAFARWRRLACCDSCEFYIQSNGRLARPICYTGNQLVNSMTSLSQQGNDKLAVRQLDAYILSSSILGLDPLNIDMARKIVESCVDQVTASAATQRLLSCSGIAAEIFEKSMGIFLPLMDAQVMAGYPVRFPIAGGDFVVTIASNLDKFRNFEEFQTELKLIEVRDRVQANVKKIKESKFEEALRDGEACDESRDPDKTYQPGCHICAMCLDELADTCLVGCGHVCLCMDCADSLPGSGIRKDRRVECPMCREKGPYIKIFYSS